MVLPAQTAAFCFWRFLSRINNHPSLQVLVACFYEPRVPHQGLNATKNKASLETDLLRRANTTLLLSKGRYLHFILWNTNNFITENIQGLLNISTHNEAVPTNIVHTFSAFLFKFIVEHISEIIL